ncbi:MAG: ATP-grasp domain-containing protein [Alphaproteobacteria bacterium]|nr:ATP-grasp domain-containing protein [Alphaproteobacteria bacterium]
MRIGVTYDLRSDYLAMGYGEEDTAEFDSEITIDAICNALTSLGWQVTRIGNIKALAEALVAGERWDAVFNFCEGLKGFAREAQVPALLDAYDIPYVFSDALTLAVTLDKSMAKRVVRNCGIPTPDFAVIESTADIRRVNLPYPLFLKPVAEGSGKGVNAKSKVDSPAALKRVATELLSRFNEPVLVETFLPGREFTVAVLGTGDGAHVLGVSEIVPKKAWVGDGYGFENKDGNWQEKVNIIAADPASAKAAGKVALAAWRALRCRDGGRVDLRNDANGKPNFIEVNPVAGLRPEHSDMCLIAAREGLSYRDLIGRIMESFLERNPGLGAKLRVAA